jgi:acetoin utilization deacetylase AcuC-like enzyme
MQALMPVPCVYHPDYVAPLPEGHRFPMPKFGRVYERLIIDGIVSVDQFHCPDEAPTDWIELAHAPEYVAAYRSGTLDERAMRRIGLPWFPRLVHRTCVAAGGTVLTARLALEHGIACNTAGGTHHAFADYGSGYCIFNDLAIAARVMQREAGIRRVLIVDLDVHQGDGTASIFSGDASVFTFSMHCGINFPFRKQQSDLDIDLDAGMEDDEYLRVLGKVLPDLLSEVKPDLVFYDAGVDPHADDLLGKLALSDNGLYRRDEFVIESCLRGGYPVACVIGGGYAKDIDRLAARHTLVFAAAEAAQRIAA